MSIQDKIKAIAEYDEWREDEVVDIGGRLYNNPQRAHLGDNLGEGFAFLGDMKYLTSLDWLHPVAMKVLDDLRKLKEGEDLSHMIFVLRHHCAIKPNNGEYWDLFNAVYDGLLFLRLKR